jgi:anti-sigma-K factor RskA
MRCEEVDELSGAYALGALPPNEQAEVEDHLASCSRHPEMASLRLTAGALAVTAPEMEPAAALKTRLMDAIRAEAAPAAGLAPATEPSPGMLDRIFGLLRSPLPGYGLAAALAVVIAVVVFSGGGGDETIVRELQGPGVSGQVVYVPDQQVAVVQVEGLAPAEAGQVYQVWAISEGTPASIGFLDVGPEGATAAMRVQLRDGQVIAVTLEPTGGSPQPTTDPLFSAEI